MWSESLAGLLDTPGSVPPGCRYERVNRDGLVTVPLCKGVATCEVGAFKPNVTEAATEV
jgi:hypothetical protein